MSANLRHLFILS